jgi:hypothetical protein
VVKQTGTVHRKRAHVIDLLPAVLDTAGASYLKT